MGRAASSPPLRSDDTQATREILGMLGASIEEDGDLWEVYGGPLQPPSSELYCRGSATTLRLGSAVCSLIEGESRLTGNPFLLRRPVGPLVEGLRQMGVDCSDTGGLPPVRVRGGRPRGREVLLRGDISSQFVSAILLIAPLAEGPTTLILTTPLESKPYISMTLEAQRRFGVQIQSSEDMRIFKVEEQLYRPTDFTVEGDWSSVAYLLAAGAIAGRVRVENISPESLQADAKITGFLREMGASVKAQGRMVEAETSSLRGIEVDVSDCPDIFPVLAILCAVADGVSTIRGLRRLEYKESNRVEAMMDGLKTMGIEALRRGDELLVVGGRPRGGVIDPRGDHRIAMAFSILGLAAEGETIIQDAGCVSKSYPLFWEEMEKLGMPIRRT
ncbi:3-phosphoshikimate 1-carboxyvinyltransferase [Candidatus Bathyarchaeota archaeon]|nr:3-phosphoshikimate 1-carboxyvinyltransferase [Candidatus Bathyarchaeota archaeon]